MKNKVRDFPGSPVVKTSHFHCRGVGVPSLVGEPARPKKNKERKKKKKKNYTLKKKKKNKFKCHDQDWEWQSFEPNKRLNP